MKVLDTDVCVGILRGNPRNLRHFRRSPDLPLEDWIRQPPPDPAARGDTPA